MDRSNQPTEVDFGHDVLNGGVGFGDGGFVVERHQEASGELDQEADEGDPAQAVEDVDVGGDVLTGDVVLDRFYFQAFVKPLVDLGIGDWFGKHEVRSNGWKILNKKNVTHP